MELVLQKLLFLLTLIVKCNGSTISLSDIELPMSKPVVEDRTTELLNELLTNYDPTVRPEKKPTVVLIDVFVRSMSKLSELDMEYSFECYFRQRWRDKRLAFNDTSAASTLTVSVSLIDRLWKPYTYIENTRIAHIHRLPSINKFLRISRDGSILYSMRISVTAKCPMDLTYFPIDKQSCKLKISSLAYPTSEVRFIWNSIDVTKKIRIAQFDLLGTGVNQENYTLHNQNYSRLIGEFKLSRHISYFVIQIYIPCLLIVAVSWVSLYINKKDASERCNLGATSLLTMSILKMECYVDMPKISYLTALDYYILICFGFVIFSIMEFALVHQDTFNIDDFEDFIANKAFYLKLREGLKKMPKQDLNKYGQRFVARRAVVLNESSVRRLLHGHTSCETSSVVARAEQSSVELDLLALYEYSKKINWFDHMTKIMFPIMFAVFNMVYFIFVYTKRYHY